MRKSLLSFVSLRGGCRVMRRMIMSLHRLLGFLLSLLFLMWFVSGIVMINHSFPRASQEKRLKNQSPIQGTLPSADQIRDILPDSVRLDALSLEMFLDRPILNLRGKGLPEALYADSMRAVELVDEPVFHKIVARWCSAPVEHVDTLYELDQWIPFERNRERLPIYKYVFADEARHELYLSPKDGEVLQFTNKDERFWAWLGAIPHWVYFTPLRQHQSLWINFVKWASGIGAIMCLIGFGFGVWIAWKTRHTRRLSPYRKPWYHWHYMSGLFFGLFAAAFAFSGMMSLMDIPDWMKKKTNERSGYTQLARRERMNGKMVGLDAYKLDYRTVLVSVPNVKKIEWASWNTFPYYRLNTDQEVLLIDASDSANVRAFRLTEEMIQKDLIRKYGDSAFFVVERLTAYDADYFSLKTNHNSLPVYRVCLNDELHTRLYYNPTTLTLRRIDDNSRIRHILYRGLHCLEFKFLTDRPWLWSFTMYTLMIGGTGLSLTGVVLSIKWFVRKIRNWFRIRY